ncbi:MAG: hypothetical protein JWP88_2368 [Flaviaesturariibacter sp.]|nr:hypothetical protein [Flaviaesturariibacter sp.]
MEKKCPARNDRASPLTIRNQVLEYLKDNLYCLFVSALIRCKNTVLMRSLQISIVEAVTFIGQNLSISGMSEKTAIL